MYGRKPRNLKDKEILQVIFKELIIPFLRNTQTSTSVFECTLKLQLLKHPMHPLFIEVSTIATKWENIT